MTSRTRRDRAVRATLALASVALLPGLTQLPAMADPATSATATATAQLTVDPDDIRTLGDPVTGPADRALPGRALPSLLQRQAVSALGAVDLRWNQYGTPSSILPADGVLARATSDDPVAAARSWLRDNAAVFGLDAAAVADLELVSEQRFAQSGARAVLFRQRFGGLAPALGGLVTVGVANGEIAYVSSSLAKAEGAPPAATLSPLRGWLAAAEDLGRGLTSDLVDQVVTHVSGGWTRLQVPGFAQEQQVRLRALPLPDGSVRPVFETNVVDVTGGAALAFTSMVDAVSGDVLLRHNKVENSTDAFQFTGTITAAECGPKHPFELTDAKTRQILVVSLAVPTDDHVVKLWRPNGELLASGDLLTSPETAIYSGDPLPRGTYSVQVCPFDSPTVPVVIGPYALLVTTSDEGAPSSDDLVLNPRWRYFAANPALDFTKGTTPRNTVVGCWEAGDGCSVRLGPFRNVAAPGPWDSLGAGVSTMTTVGNNANTHEAWASPLTPGGLLQAPVSPTRDYTARFTDAWNNSKCDPSNLLPGGNDILFATQNLFVSHNRMHDYSYYLGFTEQNYNMQLDNLGRGGAPADPEVGNVQAGAITGGQPTTLGRDNANQITLQDGIPGITNQYLFQPLAGAFYSPCTDGDLDMSIVGHEYTHAISNRMIAGPDEGITSQQGGAMGESWGDLVGAEYLFSHGYATGTSPWVVGPFATGNAKAGIRDYPIHRNPLNYSDYGFDSPGEEVHSDGEIWNGTMWDVRQALVKKWNDKFPYDNKGLQVRCAQAGDDHSPLAPSHCPGNRRWLQLMFDAFLLQQGATSMLDARDAMLAADRMRFGGKDVAVMWNAFARRGFGEGASTPSADSGEVKPSFASPRARNARVTFQAPDQGKVFVGHYEARVTPVADTLRKSKLGSSARFAPGRYDMLYVSRSRGHHRFTLTVRPGERKTVRVEAPRNLAAAAAGAKVIGATPGSRNPAFLIDGTENTNWGGVTAENVDKSRPFVAVDLAGGTHTVRRVHVSAMLNPPPAPSDPIPLAADPDSGSRFTALRKFALEACVSRCDSGKARWNRFFVSADDAFPAMRPRPVAPDLILRSFKVQPTRAAAVRLVVLENQCTGTEAYAGEQDNDPLNATDCKTATDRGTIVHAAELQVF